MPPAPITVAEQAAVHALIIAGLRLAQAAAAVGGYTDFRMRRYVLNSYVRHGNLPGWKPARTQDQLVPVRADFEAGMPLDDIAKRHRMSNKQVSRYRDRYGWKRLAPVQQRRQTVPVYEHRQAVPDYATDTVALVASPLGPKIRPLDAFVAPQSMLGINWGRGLHGQKNGASA